MDENYRLLEELLERLSYKPDYTFALKRLDSDVVTVSLTSMSLPNSYEGDRIVGLTMYNTINLKRIETPADALQAFATVIARFELHEAAEQFKCDGRSVFLPHARGDSFGDFTWADFTNLGGLYLRAVKNFLRKPKAMHVDPGEGTRHG